MFTAGDRPSPRLAFARDIDKRQANPVNQASDHKRASGQRSIGTPFYVLSSPESNILSCFYGQRPHCQGQRFAGTTSYILRLRHYSSSNLVEFAISRRLSGEAANRKDIDPISL
ncbi:hypothetical protein VTH06DRAFT_5742 [Thermothelomyces fergusii]